MATSVYETLYTSMKNKFTVMNNNNEYTLGEYMLMKANEDNSNLPATVNNDKNTSAISSFISYINDKLTVKKAPHKDKTMRRFPLRTSLTAFLSAVVACFFVFSFGIISMKNVNDLPTTVEAGEMIAESDLVYDTNTNEV